MIDETPHVKVVLPAVEILDDIDGEQILKKLEYCGRTSYKSEDRITENSAKDFIRRIIKAGHESVIEHVSLSVKVATDRGVTHEIVRHRIASFTQECVTGDTLVRAGKKEITIKQLYERKFGTHYDRTHNKTLHLRSVDEKTGFVVPNKMKDVFYKGMADVYEVKTKLGYRIKCTLNHKFLTPDGYKALKELEVGDYVFVNGRPSLLKISDEKLREHYLVDKLVPLEIAEMYDVPYSSVIRRLKKLGIFKKRLNDKNKEKYFKNHTPESFKKMAETLRRKYRSGELVVWNKGLKASDHPSVKRMAEVLRKYHHNNGSGPLNSNWKGGKNRRYAERLKANIDYCELCYAKGVRLEVHHIDGNPENNELSNLIKVCTQCHNLLHHGWHVGKKIIKDEIVSINYVGVEDVYDIEMMPPYHNYIANGFVTHNSTRYCNYTRDKFSGKVWVIKPNFLEKGSEKYQKWLRMVDEAAGHYLELIKEGWKPQEARSVLPHSTKAEICMTMNLREWRHFFKLRCSSAAHPQMREIACMILREFKKRIPVVFDDINVEV